MEQNHEKAQDALDENGGQEGVCEASASDQKGRREAKIQITVDLATFDMNVSCKELANLPFVAALLGMAQTFVLERHRTIQEMQVANAMVEAQEQAKLKAQMAGKRLHV